MKNYKHLLVLFSLLALSFTACVNDLDTIPLDQDVVTSEVVFDNPEAYEQVLAKVYAGLAVSGQQGPAGQPDIEGIDEGFGQYLRGFWYHQELSTDEALVGWNDQTIKDFNDQSWSAEDGFIFAFYSRIFYQIVLANEFLRETSDTKLDERNTDASLRQDIQGYRAEVRFLRALSYWHALDLFRNVPFVTEEDAVGSFFPEQIQGPALFEYIESELLSIENESAAPGLNRYGRADHGAVWTLLAKLYLNAAVYTGTARNADCLNYCEKVINAGYTLEENYAHLFLADNHNSNEIIFPIAFDGVNTRTWGGMTFIIRAGIGGGMDPTASGVASGWGGVRTIRQLVELFPESGGIIALANEGSTGSYPKLYVPGAYQGWDPGNTQFSLSSVNSDRTFEGYKYFPEANSPFLFTQVPAFALILGDNGADGTLESNGDTIKVADAGLYRIQANLNDNTYSLERTQWGVIGSATPGGWDMDTDMTWNAEEQAMEAFVDLVPGELKFRANDDWAINLGDDVGEGILTQDGGNIMLEKGGAYQVLLYLDKPDYTFELRLTSFDNRPMFFSEGQNLEIDDVSLFTDGYAVNKFKNITSTGQQGSDTDFPDTDFPMFRLADVLLMASEAIVRDNGDMSQALEYFNQVRTRAFGSGAGNIAMQDLDLDMLRDERARELYWECHRRTDLIRFNNFSESSYLWEWKGGVKEGRSVEAFRDIYPIPSSDLGANPNLQQNTGY
ncbi:MAG: RagB/SusD family nutrient uptake outer membrane protein [Bacteroidota bacterium]